MPSDRDIRMRIRSVRNIEKITKAMKMVAAARIRKVEALAKASRPYARSLTQAVRRITAQAADTVHPLMQVRPIEKVGVLIIGSDKGLCGSYNSNLFRNTLPELAELPGGKPERLVLVGSKTRRYFERRQFQADQVFTGWEPDLDLAGKLADLCTEWFLSEEVDEMRCFYTRPISTMVQEPTWDRLLPLADEPSGAPPPAGCLYEPGVQEALDRILPNSLRIHLHQILLEARSAELGSRLRAMTNATDNAEKLASELTLEFYRIRQANITTEILEISSGAEALKG
ncbi:MAG: ATP synthase F1 subunit gamma [Burkholderiales bacterium]|jgi:F-type H+-transporting ATPase subunit gamma|nr:ATP synthase F1 subunit gamma [Burkholderiales bacterium]